MPDATAARRMRKAVAPKDCAPYINAMSAPYLRFRFVSNVAVSSGSIVAQEKRAVNIRLFETGS